MARWISLAGAFNFALQTGSLQAQPAPDASADQTVAVAGAQGAASAPANVSPGAAEVIRLSSSGISEDVVLAYVNNSQGIFDLSADEVLYLKDLGISSQVVTAMLNHDSSLRSQSSQPGAVQPPPADQQPVPVVEAPLTPSVPASPPEDVSYFYSDLAPYGSWVVLDGIGWCWQPRTVVIAHGWRPYCDGGHWVYSDCGWFWQSNYSWGWAPFHYGRWQLHDRCGWVWTPDRVWGPAWVTWRVAGDNCGWAPMPPHAVFDVHGGWLFNGVHVGINFDFGLHANHFTFVGAHDFTQHDLGHRVLPAQQVRTVFRQTTIINSTTVANNNIMVNRGVPVDKISAATHTEIHRAVIRDVAPGASRVAPGRASSKGEPMVIRRELPARPNPVKVEAQRVDSRHPIVQHNELPPVRTAPRGLSGTSIPNSTLNSTRNNGSVRTPSVPQQRLSVEHGNPPLGSYPSSQHERSGGSVPGGAYSGANSSESKAQNPHTYAPKGYQQPTEHYSAPHSERPQSSSQSSGSSRGGDSGSHRKD